MAGVWLQTQAADLNWSTDLPKAQAQAKTDNKMVLMDFTGSDWCGWCNKFDKETLSTDKFADYAKATWYWWLWIFRIKNRRATN